MTIDGFEVTVMLVILACCLFFLALSFSRRARQWVANQLDKLSEMDS